MDDGCLPPRNPIRYCAYFLRVNVRLKTSSHNNVYERTAQFVTLLGLWISMYDIVDRGLYSGQRFANLLRGDYYQLSVPFASIRSARRFELSSEKT